MSGEDNKRAVAEFVERCQNQHDLAFADEAFQPEFRNHYQLTGHGPLDVVLLTQWFSNVDTSPWPPWPRARGARPPVPQRS